MSIVLIRHPATAWTGVRYVGQADLGWSALGRRQARQLVAQIRGRRQAPTAIVSSPLLRARQLAVDLARAKGVTPEIDERWMEVDVGRFEGATFDELTAAAPSTAQALAAGSLDVDWPEGERAVELRARVLSAFEDVRACVGDVLVVTHAGPIAVVLDAIAGSNAPARFLGAGSGVELTRRRSGRWGVAPLGARWP